MARSNKTDVWQLLRNMYSNMIPVEDIMLRVDSMAEGSGNFFVGVFHVSMWGMTDQEQPVIVGNGYWIDYSTNSASHAGKQPSAIAYELYNFYETTDQFQIIEFIKDAIRYKNKIDKPKAHIQYKLF